MLWQYLNRYYSTSLFRCNYLVSQTCHFSWPRNLSCSPINLMQEKNQDHTIYIKQLSKRIFPSLSLPRPLLHTHPTNCNASLNNLSTGGCFVRTSLASFFSEEKNYIKGLGKQGAFLKLSIFNQNCVPRFAFSC